MSPSLQLCDTEFDQAMSEITATLKFPKGKDKRRKQDQCQTLQTIHGLTLIYSSSNPHRLGFYLWSEHYK